MTHLTPPVGPRHELVVRESSRKQLLPTKLFLEALVKRFPEDCNTYGEIYVTGHTSCRLVLIAVARSNSRNPADLALVSGFSQDFISIVLEVMDEAELWDDLRFTNLLVPDLSMVLYTAFCLMRDTATFWVKAFVWLRVTCQEALFAGDRQPRIEHKYREMFSLRAKPPA